MHEHISILTAPLDRDLYLWFEPWAEGVGVPAGMTVELHAVSNLEGELEIVAEEKSTTIYGWAGSTLKVISRGAVVHDFDQPVPGSRSGLPVREAMTLFFGAPPVPDGREKSETPGKS